MKDTRHQHRHHRFDALFALLTGLDSASLPQTPHLLRDVGLPEATPSVLPSRITLAALTHRAHR